MNCGLQVFTEIPENKPRVCYNTRFFGIHLESLARCSDCFTTIYQPIFSPVIVINYQMAPCVYRKRRSVFWISLDCLFEQIEGAHDARVFP